MNLIVLAMKIYVPKWIKRKNLKSLFESTAMAFDVDMPPLDHLSYEQFLKKYAVFTRTETEKRLQSGDVVPEIERALYQHAYNLGRELRKQLRLKKKKDVFSVVRILYKVIGIDFRWNDAGSIEIHSCYFSRLYSNATCRIMSSMDEGIIAGLSGGGKLSFSQRITEGEPMCKAFFNSNGDDV
jgi:hypothetical protein